MIRSKENGFQDPDNFEVNLFQLEKVGRALVDANNTFEEPDVDVNLFQVTHGKQLENVGGTHVGDNNMEEEPDVDITLFQVSETSHLGNVGDDTIQEKMK